MNEQKRGEVLAFFWFAVSTLTLLALFSYTPEDIPFEISVPNSPAHNFVGVAGAYTAWVLVLLFGKTSYFLAPIFLCWAIAKWAGKPGQKLWVRIFSIVIFLASACSLFSLVAGFVPTVRFQAGGLLGYFVSTFFSGIFGNAGIFVSLLLFLLSILLATELLVLQAAQGVFKKFGVLFMSFLERKEEKKLKPQAKMPEFLTKPELKQPAASLAKPKPAAATPVTPAKPQAPAELTKPVSKPAAFTQNEPVPAKPQIKLSTPKSEEPKQAPKPIIEPAVKGNYTMPSLELLEDAPALDQSKMKDGLEQSSRVLEDTLRDFGIDAKVVEVEQGPTITRYELQPAAGVKVQKITALENDIALAMRAASVRIIAPIPGKSRVGIEVPNSAASTVYIKEVLQSTDFQKETSRVMLALGKDTAGTPLVCNLADMPHLLIAGATNTGKSVCINSIIMSLLYKSSPDEVKFLMIDPKMVELHFYNDLPHLICPVVTDKSKAPGALLWLVAEMERRYRILSKVGAKNIISYNDKYDKNEIKPETLVNTPDETPEQMVIKRMPYIVLVIDELADLMMASANEVETTITRLAQLARAVGIHMILATQRPSVDVITGVIKANFPARIAFQVASKVDSRTILDENGADKLLGRGDMLLMDPRRSKLVRAQGAWVQDKEIERVTSFIKNQRKAAYQDDVLTQGGGAKKGILGADFKKDEVYDEAKRVVLESGQASVSMVQRRLGLGYTRAARLIDMMEEEGIVGPYRGAKPREILVERPKSVAGAENVKENEE